MNLQVVSPALFPTDMQIKAYKLAKADPEDNNSTSTIRNGSFSDKSKKSPSCSPSLPDAPTSPPPLPPADTPLLTRVDLHQGNTSQPRLLSKCPLGSFTALTKEPQTGAHHTPQVLNEHFFTVHCSEKRPVDETDSVIVGQVLNDILDRIEGKAALLLEDSALKMAGKEQVS